MQNDALGWLKEPGCLFLLQRNTANKKRVEGGLADKGCTSEKAQPLWFKEELTASLKRTQLSFLKLCCTLLLLQQIEDKSITKLQNRLTLVYK